MKTDGTDALSFLLLLAKHGELIAEIYRSGSVEISDENRSRVYDLNTAGILTPFRAGHFRLSRAMRALLDGGTKRQRGYATGSNIAAEMGRFRPLLLDFQMASGEGRTEDAQRHEEDLLDCIFEIQDAISGELDQYLQITRNKFSDVRNAEEKARQNAHYLERARALEGSLSDLNSRETLDLFQSPLLREIEEIWHSEISSHIRPWTSTLLAAIDILKDYLFRYRAIARETRRLRALERLLRNRSDSDILEVLAGAEDQPWMRIAQEPMAEPYPDIVTPEGRDKLAEIARDLKPLAARQVRPRQSGQRKEGPDFFTAPEEVSLEEAVLSDFLSGVDQASSWVSASDWIRDRATIGFGSFLEEVLNWATSDRGCGRSVDFTKADAPDLRCGNIEIRDVLVCRAA